MKPLNPFIETDTSLSKKIRLCTFYLLNRFSAQRHNMDERAIGVSRKKM